MIVQKTVERLRQLYGQKIDTITVERIIVGVFFTGVKLSTGFGAVGYTPHAQLHARGCITSAESLPPAHFKGMAVNDLLQWRQPSALTHTVRLVAINALSALFLTKERYTMVSDNDVLDLVDLSGARKIAMVGAIRPFLRRLKNLPNIDLSVVEQKRQSLKADEAHLYVPADNAASVLPLCDTVIITGASIANGTMTALLQLTQPGSLVIVAGPTASLLPDALFDLNAHVVSGVTVTDIDKALDLLAEGAGAYRLFTEGCVRKTNVFKGCTEDANANGCLR